MLTTKFLKGIMTEAYPVIKRQVEDAKIVSGFRDTVAANGGDWSALKALIKAHVEDTLDEEGGNKRVQKILDKADSSNAYAGMLGLIMNEKNFIADDEDFDPSTGEITPKQDAPHPASDLTASPSLSGQVAPILPETATSDEGAAAPATGASPVIASVGDSGAQPTGGEDVNGPDVPATHEDFDGALDIAGATGKPVEALATAAPLYAAPGIVTMEQTPPKPVKWHPYAQCFPTVLGDDLKALERDIQQAGAVAEPIVKIGNLILDGRARYGIARSMLIDYPVVQYAGSDPLMDVIRWNLASRFDRMTSGQISATAKALCKLEPARTDDIMQAFGLEIAEAAE